MDKHIVFTHLAEAITTAEAASKREHALRVISARRRVMHSKRAVYAVTVAKFNVIVGRSEPLVVASLAEVVRAKAVEEGHVAAEHALPVDLLTTMLLAFVLTSTIGLHLALLAAKVLFLGVLFDAKLHLAVNHATKVWLLAVVTLVECAAVHCELEQLAFVVVTRSR